MSKIVAFKKSKFVSRKDDQLISIYLKYLLFIKIIFAYCFLNVFYLGDNTFQVLEAESIIDT